MSILKAPDAPSLDHFTVTFSCLHSHFSHLSPHSQMATKEHPHVPLADSVPPSNALDAHLHCGCGTSFSFITLFSDSDAQHGQLVAQHPHTLHASVLHSVIQRDRGQQVGGQQPSLVTFSGILQQQVVIFDMMFEYSVCLVRSVGEVVRERICRYLCAKCLLQHF
jgi:hypothetical protein